MFVNFCAFLWPLRKIRIYNATEVQCRCVAGGAVNLHANGVCRNFIGVADDTARDGNPEAAVPVLNLKLGNALATVLAGIESFCECRRRQIVLKVITQREDVDLTHKIGRGEGYREDVAGVIALGVVVPTTTGAPVLSFAIAVDDC